VLVAGEPEGCSGKANALAYAVERAEHDRFVWTDDDFDRDPDWVDRLVRAAHEAGGPVSAIPFFTGAGWWRLFEPWNAALFAFAMYHQVGGVADIAWGGGVTFTREELGVSAERFADELRTVLSDDYLLTQRLPEVTPVRSMVTPVTVAGGPRAVYHRIVRFTRIVGVNEGFALGLVVNGAVGALALLYPVVLAPLVTLVFAGVYRSLDLPGRGFLLAYPSTLVAPVALLVSVLVREFEWGGRRYRFDGDGVDVLD
jgi:hypothetical protein